MRWDENDDVIAVDDIVPSPHQDASLSAVTDGERRVEKDSTVAMRLVIRSAYTFAGAVALRISHAASLSPPPPSLDATDYYVYYAQFYSTLYNTVTVDRR